MLRTNDFQSLDNIKKIKKVIGMINRKFHGILWGHIKYIKQIINKNNFWKNICWKYLVYVKAREGGAKGKEY